MARFKQAIANSDGLLIATPEYDHRVLGVLKNAVDWPSRPRRASVLTDKPVAIMGATPGPGGTARAQAQDRVGLTYTSGYVLPLPQVLVPLARHKFDGASNLIEPIKRKLIEVEAHPMTAGHKRERSATDAYPASMRGSRLSVATGSSRRWPGSAGSRRRLWIGASLTIDPWAPT